MVDGVSSRGGALSQGPAGFRSGQRLKRTLRLKTLYFTSGTGWAKAEECPQGASCKVPPPGILRAVYVEDDKRFSTMNLCISLTLSLDEGDFNSSVELSIEDDPY